MRAHCTQLFAASNAHQRAPYSAGPVSRPCGNPPNWKPDHVLTAELLLAGCLLNGGRGSKARTLTFAGVADPKSVCDALVRAVDHVNCKLAEWIVSVVQVTSWPSRSVSHCRLWSALHWEWAVDVVRSCSISLFLVDEDCKRKRCDNLAFSDSTKRKTKIKKIGPNYWWFTPYTRMEDTLAMVRHHHSNSVTLFLEITLTNKVNIKVLLSW